MIGGEDADRAGEGHWWVEDRKLEEGIKWMVVYKGRKFDKGGEAEQV